MPRPTFAPGAGELPPQAPPARYSTALLGGAEGALGPALELVVGREQLQPHRPKS